MADFALLVNGKEFGGWETVTVERSIETMCSSFSFGFSDAIDGSWPVEDGDECAVVFDGKPVVTGYADRATLSLRGGDTIGGRDRMADVVDSAPRLNKWTFRDSTAEAIATALCEPFGVAVRLQAGLKLETLQRFSVDIGDTGGAVLDKLCKVAGVLAVPTETGGLMLVRGGSTVCATAIVEGGNLLDGSSVRDATNRFGEYRVLAQQRGTDNAHGAYAAGVKGVAIDGNVRPQRLHVIRPDGNMTPTQAKERAEYEASVRAARGRTLQGLAVQGWTQGNGVLWPINALVHVDSPRLRVKGEFLITRAAYTRSKSGGTVTTIDASSSFAFKPAPQVRSNAAAGWKELKGGA